MKGQRAGNAFWTRSLAWQSNYAGSVSWFQECVGGIQTHQLLTVSQEQLRMATVTERVADDVIHQELRAIGENGAADGQVLPKYLDISRDPQPPSAGRVHTNESGGKSGAT